ncbi:hypothetical protein V493_08267 [Pseudogymnoascus sp. VKM F-4281 (FW-2241)]|nr:hypothetical protein V493_08267 [Pseudogymnoascus sp. VKM F-4281 (FW-2241)]
MRQPGCLNCRERHVKCDKERPTCSTCRNAKYPTTCEYASKRFRFRQSRYLSSLQQQRQITSPPVNLSRDLPLPPGSRRNIEEQSVRDDDGDPPLVQGSDSEVTIPAGRDESIGADLPTGNNAITTTTTTGVQDSVERQYSHFPAQNNASHGSETSWLPPSPFSSRYNDTSTGSGQSGTILRSTYSSPHVTSSNSDGGLDGRDSVSGSKSNSSRGWEKLPSDGLLRASQGPARLLSDELECNIFGFYVTKAGRWLDIGSPSHYFQSYIPQLALAEPLVLAACLACASHVMYLLGIVENSVEQHYNAKVLELLIPLLSSSDEATSSNDALLATTVILRMSEQFLEVGNDAQRHLNGAASIFMDGNTDWSPVESSLAIACFWTHQRETIRICFLREQPCQFDLSYLSLADDDLNLPVSTDEAWTNRMTFFLLRVCTLCWGTATSAIRDDTTVVTDLKRLRLLIDRWKENLPRSFRPWGVHENGNDAFPLIQYFASWHVVAWQFYYTAKVMLAVYCPEDQPMASLHVR